MEFTASVILKKKKKKDNSEVSLERKEHLTCDIQRGKKMIFLSQYRLHPYDNGAYLFGVCVDVCVRVFIFVNVFLLLYFFVIISYCL